MFWFVKSRIEINYIVRYFGWRDDIFTKFDYIFCFCRDTFSNIQKSFNLYLNYKVFLFIGLILKVIQV